MIEDEWLAKIGGVVVVVVVVMVVAAQSKMSHALQFLWFVGKCSSVPYHVKCQTSQAVFYVCSVRLKQKLSTPLEDSEV
ncbi:hypothetical protein E2C01_007067 [Portunus trituberculatus]|uniref:Uncharacterized protein n=1 Tax=Portunus trituberculatus TaxID=210409 RepID=A0A5B7D3I1_PORTR|nr:hypothetical protein [Portunus trituberculatus]